MKKSVFVLFLAVCCAALVFAGGGGQQTQPQAAPVGGGNPVLTMTSPYFSAEVPVTPNITAKLEQITGYRLDVTWLPSTAYNDMFNTRLASNTLTQMVITSDLKGSAYLNAVDEGIFWELENYVNDYPNLRLLGDARFNNVKRNGHIMGIPRARELVRQGINYRQDWAEAIGLTAQPKTTADLDKMVRGFATQPGARYGLTMGCAGANPAIPEGIAYIAIWLGAPQNWGFNSQGQFTHAWLTDEFTQSVEMFRTWYADGLINRNFVEINSEDALRIINTEESGLVFLHTDSIENRFADLNVKNPNARLYFAHEINGKTIATAGFNGSIAMSKSEVKDEALLRHCLQFINNLGSRDWQTVIHMGLEGETYSVVDGFASQTQEQSVRHANTSNNYAQINCFQGVLEPAVPLKRIPVMDAIMAERARFKTPVIDPTIPFVSPTQAAIGVTDLDPIRCDAINRYIMGVIDKAGYQAAQKRWLDAGGAQVTKEFEEQVRANQ